MKGSRKVKELLAEAYILYMNHNSNNGTLDYSIHLYNKLMKVIEEVEVGYLKADYAKIDSDRASKLRAEEFTITALEATNKLQDIVDLVQYELKKTYFLFGTRACNFYRDRGVDALLHDIAGGYRCSVFVFVTGETTAEELLHVYGGHGGDYNRITSEDFKKIHRALIKQF